MAVLLEAKDATVLRCSFALGALPLDENCVWVFGERKAWNFHRRLSLDERVFPQFGLYPLAFFSHALGDKLFFVPNAEQIQVHAVRFSRR